MLLRLLVFPFAILVSLSQLSIAQTNDWAITRQLLPGQRIKVATIDGKSHVGSVRSVDEDGVQVGKDEVFHKQDVEQILLWSPGHHGRNTLIGLASGAVVGVAFGASCGKDQFVNRSECMAVGAPLFGGVGAGIGALLPSHGKWREVYRSR